jgi:hypothetical protein
MSSAQAQSLHAPETRAKLHGWFSRWGSSTEVEIEARVREVDPAKFEHLLRKLRSNPHWSVAPVTITSSDLLHASGVRETRGGPEGTSFLRKQKLETFDVFGTDSHHPVRLQASSEKPVGPCTTPLSMVRHKRRHTFVHKGLFKFELTEVKTGPSWETACHEDSEYEIEVEYCGQRAFEPKQTYLNYIIDAFVGKVRTRPRARSRSMRPSRARVHPRTRLTTTGSLPRRATSRVARARVAGARRGARLRAAGRRLGQPEARTHRRRAQLRRHGRPLAGHVRRARARARLPALAQPGRAHGCPVGAARVDLLGSRARCVAERVAQTRVRAHALSNACLVRSPGLTALRSPRAPLARAGADGSERAHLMSLPSVMDGESYALFHFSGHVPRAAIARGAPNFNL